ncbi:MAG: PHP domain-containing protein [Candidatus Sumerlaeia bacterium]|nr:PHP domain-containing protein [Candidatus Sumerlaeia bacterium]
MQPDSIPFVHLGARSDVSLGESIARVEELCWEASRDMQGYLALTDLNSLGRAPRFSLEAARAGLKPIFGAEIGVLPHGETQFRGTHYRARLLVYNEQGWKTLVRLVNQARTVESPNRPPCLNFARLLEDPRGLFLFLGGEHGQLTQLVRNGDFERAEALVGSARDAFGSDFLVIELPPNAPETAPAEASALQTVAGYFGLRTVVVPKVQVAHPADDPIFRLLHEKLTPPPQPTTRLGDLVRPLAERPYLQPRALVAERWKTFPEALALTFDIAETCAGFSLPQPARRFPVHEFHRGVDANSFIWNSAFSIATQRYGDLPSRYKERLDREFRQIVEAGLADAVVTLVRLHEELEGEGIQRGPGAGILTHSLIASLLGLTRLDPLKFDLPFELSPGLASGPFPLLELSIPEMQEEQAFDALQRLFNGQATRVGAWQSWKFTQAVEVVSMQIGHDARRVTTTLRKNSFLSEKEAVRNQPVTFLPSLDLPLESDQVLAWMSRRLEGRAKELAIEPHQFTFGGEPLDTMVPRRFFPIEGRRGVVVDICEWSSEELGRMRHGRLSFTHPELLDLIGHATELAREQGEFQYAPERTPITDPATFRLLREGNTGGIAPLEAPSVRRRLRQGQPGDLHQLLKLLRSSNGETDIPEPDFATLLLAHVCAAIKAHRPLAFFAAALSRVNGNGRRTALLLEEIRSRGIPIADVDINYSSWNWTVERDTLRPGFMIVEAMTPAAGEEITLKRRELHFADILELVQRTDRNRLKLSQVKALVKSGAFDNMGKPRSIIMAQLEEIAPRLAPGRQQPDDLSFFGQDTQWWEQQVGAPVAGSDDPKDLLAQEREVCHAVVRESLSTEEEQFLRAAKVRPARTLHQRDDGQVMTLLGVVGPVESSSRVPGLVLCDVGGCLIRATGEVGERLASRDLAGRPALLTGRLERENFQWRLDLVGLQTIPRAMEDSRQAGSLLLDLCSMPAEHWKPLGQLVRQYPGTTTIKMKWMPVEPGRAFRRIAASRILHCPATVEALNRLVGPGNWQTLPPSEEQSVSHTSIEAIRRLSQNWVRRAITALRLW